MSAVLLSRGVTRNRIQREPWTRNQKIVKRINCQSRFDRDGQSQLAGEKDPVNGNRKRLFRASLHVDLDYLPALSSAFNKGPLLGN